ncbi:MAG: hypothetical protein AB3N23_00480 [Paracoccaceae bacterium]
MRIHALWCHPRSMSTAVERIMRERGDLGVLHEPFMYDYYLSGNRKPFAGFEPDADHPTTYAGIRAMILEKATDRPVFFKDMAYYVTESLTRDPAFAREMSHAFLIRDPAESVISYAKRQPDVTLEEIGIEAQWTLYRTLVDMGITPTVLSAQTVRANPTAEMTRYWSDVGLPDAPHALSWDTEVPDDWRSVQNWHQDVLSSTAIVPPDETRDVAGELAALGEPFVSYAAHHRPFYDKFMATQQALSGSVVDP